MRRLPLSIFAFIAACFFWASCSKTVDVLVFDDINLFYPQQVGKFIIYRLDSTVFVNFGTREEVHSYEVRDMVDAKIFDNEGRESYRILRSIRLNDTQPWGSNATFMVTPTTDKLEFVENNLRFIKLVNPLRNLFEWKGNKFIDAHSIGSPFRFLDDWDYRYSDLGQTKTYNGKQYTNTVTINQRDETIGSPNNPAAFSERNFGMEVYAKGLGLVFKEFIHWEYQPPTSQSGSGFKEGYGIKLTILSNN